MQKFIKITDYFPSDHPFSGYERSISFLHNDGNARHSIYSMLKAQTEIARRIEQLGVPFPPIEDLQWFLDVNLYRQSFSGKALKAMSQLPTIDKPLVVEREYRMENYGSVANQGTVPNRSRQEQESRERTSKKQEATPVTVDFERMDRVLDEADAYFANQPEKEHPTQDTQTSVPYEVEPSQYFIKECHSPISNYEVKLAGCGDLIVWMGNHGASSHTIANKLNDFEDLTARLELLGVALVTSKNIATFRSSHCTLDYQKRVRASNDQCPAEDYEELCRLEQETKKDLKAMLKQALEEQKMKKHQKTKTEKKEGAEKQQRKITSFEKTDPRYKSKLCGAERFVVEAHKRGMTYNNIAHYLNGRPEVREYLKQNHLKPVAPYNVSDFIKNRCVFSRYEWVPCLSTCLVKGYCDGIDAMADQYLDYALQPDAPLDTQSKTIKKKEGKKVVSEASLKEPSKPVVDESWKKMIQSQFTEIQKSLIQLQQTQTRIQQNQQVHQALHVPDTIKRENKSLLPAFLTRDISVRPFLVKTLKRITEFVDKSETTVE